MNSKIIKLQKRNTDITNKSIDYNKSNSDSFYQYMLFYQSIKKDFTKITKEAKIKKITHFDDSILKIKNLININTTKIHTNNMQKFINIDNLNKNEFSWLVNHLLNELKEIKQSKTNCSSHYQYLSNLTSWYLKSIDYMEFAVNNFSIYKIDS